MPEVHLDQLTITIRAVKPKRAWDYYTNEYYEADSGDLLDPDTMPEVAKGHSYSVYAISTTAGEFLLLKNVLRAWDAESIPLVEELGGGPYDPSTEEVEDGKIIQPTKYRHQTVAIPLDRHKPFLTKAERLGWEVVDLTWKSHGLEELRNTLKAVQEDKVSAEDGAVVLEHYSLIQANPKDPHLNKDFRGKRELRTLLARLRTEIQTREPDLVTSEQEDLESVLHYLRAVFPWAAKAEVQGDLLMIPLGKGALALSMVGIEYREGTVQDGITLKKGGRLDSLLDEAT